MTQHPARTKTMQVPCREQTQQVNFENTKLGAFLEHLAFCSRTPSQFNKKTSTDLEKAFFENGGAVTRRISLGGPLDAVLSEAAYVENAPTSKNERVHSNRATNDANSVNSHISAPAENQVFSDPVREPKRLTNPYRYGSVAYKSFLAKEFSYKDSPFSVQDLIQDLTEKPLSSVKQLPSPKNINSSTSPKKISAFDESHFNSQQSVIDSGPNTSGAEVLSNDERDAYIIKNILRLLKERTSDGLIYFLAMDPNASPGLAGAIHRYRLEEAHKAFEAGDNTLFESRDCSERTFNALSDLIIDRAVDVYAHIEVKPILPVSQSVREKYPEGSKIELAFKRGVYKNLDIRTLNGQNSMNLQVLYATPNCELAVILEKESGCVFRTLYTYGGTHHVRYVDQIENFKLIYNYQQLCSIRSERTDGEYVGDGAFMAVLSNLF